MTSGDISKLSTMFSLTTRALKVRRGSYWEGNHPNSPICNMRRRRTDLAGRTLSVFTELWLLHVHDEPTDPRALCPPPAHRPVPWGRTGCVPCLYIKRWMRFEEFRINSPANLNSQPHLRANHVLSQDYPAICDSVTPLRFLTLTRLLLITIPSSDPPSGMHVHSSTSTTSHRNPSHKSQTVLPTVSHPITTESEGIYSLT